MSREPEHVASRILLHVRASVPANSTIDVVVNGNAALADYLARHLETVPGSKAHAVRVWHIDFGDKANAWNQYIHRIWSGESVACFMDGYVRPLPEAITRLIAGAGQNGSSLGATGVPTVGRSASATRTLMQQNSGFHGNLCCIKAEALSGLRAAKIRLPLGLYRTDALMGAFLLFGLDPSRNGWDESRIAVIADASWETEPKRWWRVNDLISHWRRLVRQARGVFENQAAKELLAVRRAPPASLPSHASVLVREWAQRYPRKCAAMAIKHPLAVPWLVRGHSKPQPKQTEPTLLAQYHDCDRSELYAAPRNGC
jgi:hypothetical protein